MSSEQNTDRVECVECDNEMVQTAPDDLIEIKDTLRDIIDTVVQGELPNLPPLPPVRAG